MFPHYVRNDRGASGRQHESNSVDGPKSASASIRSSQTYCMMMAVAMWTDEPRGQPS